MWLMYRKDKLLEVVKRFTESKLVFKEEGCNRTLSLLHYNYTEFVALVFIETNDDKGKK